MRLNYEGVRTRQPFYFGPNVVDLMFSLGQQYNGAALWVMNNPPGSLVNAVTVWNTALAVGREQILNGGFDTADYWNPTFYGTGWSIAGGVASYDDTGIAGLQQQNVYLRGNAEYVLTFTISNAADHARMTVYGDSGSALNVLVAEAQYVNGPHEVTFTAPASQTHLTLFAYTSGSSFDLDDVSLKQKNIMASSAYPGPELVTNGGFDAWTGDYPDDWDHSTNGANSVISQVDSGEAHGATGLGSINIWTDNGTNTFVRQDGILTPGKKYEATIVVSAVVAGTARLGNYNDGTAYYDITATGTHKVQFTAVDAGVILKRLVGATDVTIDSISVREVNPMNATIIGATPGAVGPAGQYALDFDGINDYGKLHSPDFNSFFRPEESTLMVAFRPRLASFWSDGNFYWLAEIGANTDNRIILYKNNTGTLRSYLLYGGHTVSLGRGVTGLTGTGWHLLGVSVSKSQNDVSSWIDGKYIGPKQDYSYFDGDWNGNLSPLQCTFGATATPTHPHNGFEALLFYVRGVLTAAHHQRLAQVLGAYYG